MKYPPLSQEECERIVAAGPFPTGFCHLCGKPAPEDEHFCDACWPRLVEVTPKPRDIGYEGLVARGWSPEAARLLLESPFDEDPFALRRRPPRGWRS